MINECLKQYIDKQSLTNKFINHLIKIERSVNEYNKSSDITRN